MSDPDLICRQMAQIRHDLHQDGPSVPNGAKQLLDWTCLPRNYPLLSVCAALVAGYVLVPRRSRRREDGRPAALNGSFVKKRPGLVAQALGFFWPIAEQAVQASAAAWIENQIGRCFGQPTAPGGPDREEHREPRTGQDSFSSKPADRR